MDKVIIDTSALFALQNPEDDHHKLAIAINDSLVYRNCSLILPNFLLAETHTILNRRLGPMVARKFLNAALQDFEIERITVEDEWSAHALLQEVSRKKDLSYFDAVTLALAQRLEIDEIFTFDKHFELLGLKASRP